MPDGESEPTTAIEPSSRAIIGQLASPVRLRVVAALALGARLPSQISDLAGVKPDQAAAALNRLLRAGLVVAAADGFELRFEVFANAARAEAPQPVADDFDSFRPDIAKVLRAYVVGNRLSAIPAAGRKRTTVLTYLASVFEPGRRYPEAEVNAILRSWHPDVAALRRYLVDESLLARADGEYWRIGGWLDVS